MSAANAKQGKQSWPSAALSAVSSFCTQAAPQPALLAGLFPPALHGGGHLIVQHTEPPADVVALPQAAPWPANTFLRIAAECAPADVLPLQLAEWLRICRPQGLLLLLSANPYCWPHFRQPAHLPSLPPQHLAETAQSIGWHLVETQYYKSAKLLPVHFFDSLLDRCTAPVYALLLQKRVYAVPPAQGAAAAENVELAALGIARGQAKVL